MTAPIDPRPYAGPGGWQDLTEGILSEFAERALYSFGLEEAAHLAWQRSYYERVRCLPDVRGRELAAQRRRRSEGRALKAAGRLCARCGARVERVARFGKVPEYCTRRCMRAGIWARYGAKKALPGPGRPRGHINCANCAEFALDWRGDLLAKLESNRAA